MVLHTRARQMNTQIYKPGHEIPPLKVDGFHLTEAARLAGDHRYLPVLDRHRHSPPRLHILVTVQQRRVYQRISH